MEKLDNMAVDAVVATAGVEMDAGFTVYDFINEKGNVKPKVRAGIKEQYIEQVLSTDYFTANDGSLLRQVGVTVEGDPIYVRLVVTVTDKGEFATPKKATPKTKEATVIPKLKL